MFWMRNKENNFPIRTLIWRSGVEFQTGYEAIEILMRVNLYMGLGTRKPVSGLRPNKKTSVFRVTGLNILIRVGTYRVIYL